MLDTFDLVIHALPADRGESLRVIRLFAGFTIAEAKEIQTHVEAHLPCRVLMGVRREKAEDLSKQLGAKGGRGEIEPSALDHPMVLWPRAAASYDMTFFGGISEK